MFHWISLLSILLVLVGVELSLYLVLSLSWSAVAYFLKSGRA